MKRYLSLCIAVLFLVAVVHAQPFGIVLYNLTTELTDSCDGGDPFPDGTPVCIYWDEDENGPTMNDRQVPVCDDPPNCENGPAGTFNMDQFRLNGDSPDVGMGPGYFYQLVPFYSVGIYPAHPTFYLRICDYRDSTFWFSNSFTPQPGMNLDLEISRWVCTGLLIDQPPMVMGVTASDSLYEDYVLVEWVDVSNEIRYLVYCDNIMQMAVIGNTVSAQVPCQTSGRHAYRVVACNFYGCGPISYPDSGSCRAPNSNGIISAALLNSFSMHQNYPNPFNPVTEIGFDLPRTIHTTVRVFDVTGRQVVLLQDGILPAGKHSVSFDGQALPSGMYFCRVQAGEQIGQIKMLLMK